MSYITDITIKDSGSLDAFSRLRVSNTEAVFTTQSTYNLDPIIMEPGNTGTGVAPAHSANDRMVALSATAGTGTSFVQSFQYLPYQPGRSQFVAITGVLGTAVANAQVDVGYFDAANGVILRQDGTNGLKLILRTSTGGSVSDANVVSQSSWNIDKLDGTGGSGLTLDVTKTFILVIDLQFLGMGRVRVGFDINGILYYVHQFTNANNLTVPYMQTANLPIGMLVNAASTATTKTSYFKCAAVISEGGSLDDFGYLLSSPETTATAGNGTRQVIQSIRPKTTYNTITNRALFDLQNISLAVTGNSAVRWELVLGGNYSGQAWSDVDTTYSAFEYTSTPGTFTNLTGGVVIASGYAAAGSHNTIVIPSIEALKYPITLNRAGAVRALGTLSLLVTGLTQTSACRASFNFKEVR